MLLICIPIGTRRELPAPVRGGQCVAMDEVDDESCRHRDQWGRHFDIPVCGDCEVVRKEVRESFSALEEGFLEDIHDQRIPIDLNRIGR